MLAGAPAECAHALPGRLTVRTTHGATKLARRRRGPTSAGVGGLVSVTRQQCHRPAYCYASALQRPHRRFEGVKKSLNTFWLASSLELSVTTCTAPSAAPLAGGIGWERKVSIGQCCRAQSTTVVKGLGVLAAQAAGLARGCRDGPLTAIRHHSPPPCLLPAKGRPPPLRPPPPPRRRRRPARHQPTCGQEQGQA